MASSFKVVRMIFNVDLASNFVWKDTKWETHHTSVISSPLPGLHLKRLLLVLVLDNLIFVAARADTWNVQYCYEEFVLTR
eukprot:877720-Amphidinium_carterae.1